MFAAGSDLVCFICIMQWLLSMTWH